MKKAARKVMWVGRATVFTVGLAMTLALMIGVATTALAAVPGDPFKLGQLNAVDAASNLVGRVNGAMLGIENQSPGSKGAKAPALSLKVAPNNPPLVANPEAATATGLSADELDGRDSASFADGTGGKADDSDKLDGKDQSAFFSGDVYVAEHAVQGPGSSEIAFVYAYCDQGDVALGGGGSVGTGLTNWWDDEVLASYPQDVRTWGITVRDNIAPNKITAKAVCADFPPNH